LIVQAEETGALPEPPRPVTVPLYRPYGIVKEEGALKVCDPRETTTQPTFT